MTASQTTAPPQVKYEWGGTILIAGPPARALPVTTALGTEPGLRVVAVIDGPTSEAQAPRGGTIVSGRVAHVSGYLGKFTAEASSGSGLLDLSPLSPNRTGFFDVVVDLCDSPLCTFEVNPIGYFRPANAMIDVESLAAEIAVLSAGFTKPRYVRYIEELCTHGAQGLTGCTRCLDACPADALASSGSRIALEPGLCRGCGSCTVACPTGALISLLPRPSDLRSRLRKILEALEASGNASPTILFHAENAEARDSAALATNNDPDVLAVEVPSLAAIGSDTWLGALAMGAAEVLVLDDPRLPPTARRVVEEAIEGTREVLGGLGTDAERLRLVSIDTLRQRRPLRRDIRAAPSDFQDAKAGKRFIVERAIEALGAASLRNTSRMPLSEASALGTVRVDEAACTLCLACAHICPTGALTGDAAGETLRFTEGACVQCGLCTAACPEDAIELEPSLEPDAGARCNARVVHRGALASCERCGAPFLPRALLHASLARIGGEKGANSEVTQMLNICPRCRSQAAMREPFIGGEREPH